MYVLLVEFFYICDKFEVKRGYMVNVFVVRWLMEWGYFGSEFVVVGCEFFIINI